MVKTIELITARGHPMIKATHPTTLMITKDREAGPRGDCIVAVAADKAVADLDTILKKSIKAGRPVKITFKVGDSLFVVRGSGHPDLTFSSKTDIVVRKSTYTCGRTLAVGADKAASDLPRKFVSLLRNPLSKVQIFIEVG
jgi:hypothetical protein